MNADRRLRVAHFTLGRCNPESANGIDKTVYHLARTQAALGHDVAVFSLTDKPAIPIPGAAVYTCAPRRFPMPLLTAQQRDLLVTRAPWNVPRALVGQIAGWRPDVLHLHFVHLPPNVFLVRSLAPAPPYCVTIHGGLSGDAPHRRRWQKRLFAALFERAYLERAAFLHATSDQDVAGLDRYGVRNQTVMAPNGIDAGALPPPFDPTALQQLDPRIRGRRVFVYLGRLDPQQKGLDLLVRAFAAARLPDAALVLIGPDWRGGRRQLETLARTQGVDDSVIFAGPAFGDRKTALVGGADVFVHPSRWEGVPFSVLEAAAMARACLLTPAADHRGVLSRMGGALAVSPTVDALAAGLRELRGSSADRLAAMGARARAAVVAEFSWPRTAQTLIDAYRACAADGRE